MSLYLSRHVCDTCGKLHIGGWNANSTCVCPDNPYTAPEPARDDRRANKLATGWLRLEA